MFPMRVILWMCTRSWRTILTQIKVSDWLQKLRHFEIEWNTATSASCSTVELIQELRWCDVSGGDCCHRCVVVVVAAPGRQWRLRATSVENWRHKTSVEVWVTARVVFTQQGFTVAHNTDIVVDYPPMFIVVVVSGEQLKIAQCLW